MGFREYIQRLEQEGTLLKIRKPVSKNLEAAGILKAAEPRPVLIERVKETPYRIAGNLFCGKERIASYLGIETRDLIPTLSRAIEKRSRPEEVEEARGCGEFCRLG